MIRTTAIVALGALLAGCRPSAGAFEGAANPPLVPRDRVAQPQPSVPFLWTSVEGGKDGKIESALPDGRGFVGRFHEIHGPADQEVMGPFYDEWYDTWTGPLLMGWPHYAPDAFLVHYKNEVLALLQSNDGTRMRCAFELADPHHGMAAGGRGRCQLSDGSEIDAYFAAASRNTP